MTNAEYKTKTKGVTKQQVEQEISAKRLTLRNEINVVEAAQQDGYKKSIYDYTNDDDLEVVCDVCRSEDFDDGDKDAPYGTVERIGDSIVICDQCNTAVH